MSVNKQLEDGHDGQKQEQGKEESLTTLLDEDQRGELTLLIASAMVAMRRTITSSFDANAGMTQDIVQDLTSEDDKIMNQSVDPATADIEKIEAERKLREQRQKELSAPQMKELKESSLKFFDDWRGKVIERVGEVVNSKEKARTDMKKADPPESKTHAPEDSKVDAGKTDESDPSTEPSVDKFYPPIETPLSSLSEKSKILIIHSTLLLLLSLEHYIAPSRILLLYLTSSLQLPLRVLTEDEEKMAKGLLEAAKHMSGETETQKKAEENQSSRKWKVGIASVAGAALIGVTGGLAAPLVAAGVGSVMGGLGLGATAAAGYLGTVAGSTVLVGGLFGAYGGRMTGQMMDNYAREVEDFAFLPIRQDGKDVDVEEDKDKTEIAKKSAAVEKTLTEETGVQKPQDGKGQTQPAASESTSSEDKEGKEDPANRRLRVTIGITGWLTSKQEVVTPWRVIGHDSEVFALRFELEALMHLGNSLDAMVSSAAWGYAKSEMIKRTVFAELMGAAAWPLTILQIGRVVDNPFSIARSRAEKAGEVLADALINKAQGERPVTLIGYSLGARVIYSCLMALAKRRAFGLIETSIFIGAPCPSTTADWRVMRSVVAGRLVNVFSENDYVLGFLYRSSSIQYGVAGLQKISGIPSVENVDVSDAVSGHLRYRYLVGSILQKIGFEDIDATSVQKEEAAFKHMLEEEKKTTYTDTAKSKGAKVLEDNPLGVHAAPSDSKNEKDKSEDEKLKEKDAAEKEATQLERQIQEKTQKGMLESAWGYLPLRLQGKGAVGAAAAAGGGGGVGKEQTKPPQPAEQAAKDGKVEAAMGGYQEKGWTESLTGGFLGGGGGSAGGGEGAAGADKKEAEVKKKGSKESVGGKEKGWTETLSGGFLGGLGAK
ncbi:MAG: hypothetical protein Q9164_001503 [Protoblastenia rupestris]